MAARADDESRLRTGAYRAPRRAHADARARAQSLSLGIQAIDGLLRSLHRVREFTDDPDCMLRISWRARPYAVILEDGTRIAAGERVLELHLWNEHVPRFPSAGPSLAWAAKVERRLDRSLRLLAGRVGSRPELSAVRALYAASPLAPRGAGRQLVRIARRFGFETVGTPPPTWRQRAHHAACDVLVAGLVWAYQPQSFRRSALVREHLELWMSRHSFLARYGETATVAERGGTPGPAGR